MAHQIKSAEIELVAILGQAKLTVEDLMKVKIGDIIPFHIAENIIATVNEVPVLECKYGIFNDQYSIKVEKMISSSITEPSNGGKS